MGNVFTVVLTPLMHGLVKLVTGLTPQTLEIEPGTFMNIWVPKQAITTTTTTTTYTKTHHKQVLYAPPKKPAVLLVHCFAMDGIFSWFFQVLALSGKYSVYVPDLLFFGGSTTDRTERSVDFQAEFLAKGMEILRVDKVSLVGLSYGGIIGFKMAKLYPHLVHSMVVTAAVTELTESVSRECYHKLWISSWPEFLLPETVEGVRRMFMIGTHNFPWLPGFVHRHFLEVMFSSRKERHELLDALVVPEKDVTTDYDYPQRIHLLWGDTDKIFGLELVETMKKKLGEKTTLEVIPNAGHLVPLERPFAYHRCLKRFLESLKE